jgi:phage-related protein
VRFDGLVPRKDFESFPDGAQMKCLRALTVAAEGGMTDIAKPMRGLASEVFEIALRFRGDAYRTVYAVHLGEPVWVVHSFPKKSRQGIKTPRHEIDLVKLRLRWLKEALR